MYLDSCSDKFVELFNAAVAYVSALHPGCACRFTPVLMLSASRLHDHRCSSQQDPFAFFHGPPPKSDHAHIMAAVKQRTLASVRARPFLLAFVRDGYPDLAIPKTQAGSINDGGLLRGETLRCASAFVSSFEQIIGDVLLGIPVTRESAGSFCDAVFNYNAAQELQTADNPRAVVDRLGNAIEALSHGICGSASVMILQSRQARGQAPLSGQAGASGQVSSQESDGPTALLNLRSTTAASVGESPGEHLESFVAEISRLLTYFNRGFPSLRRRDVLSDHFSSDFYDGLHLNTPILSLPCEDFGVLFARQRLSGTKPAGLSLPGIIDGLMDAGCRDGEEAIMAAMLKITAEQLEECPADNAKFLRNTSRARQDIATLYSTDMYPPACIALLFCPRPPLSPDLRRAPYPRTLPPHLELEFEPSFSAKFILPLLPPSRVVYDLSTLYQQIVNPRRVGGECSLLFEEPRYALEGAHPPTEEPPSALEGEHPPTHGPLAPHWDSLKTEIGQGLFLYAVAPIQSALDCILVFRRHDMDMDKLSATLLGPRAPMGPDPSSRNLVDDRAFLLTTVEALRDNIRAQVFDAGNLVQLLQFVHDNLILCEYPARTCKSERSFRAHMERVAPALARFVFGSAFCQSVLADLGPSSSPLPRLTPQAQPMIDFAQAVADVLYNFDQRIKLLNHDELRIAVTGAASLDTDAMCKNLGGMLKVSVTTVCPHFQACHL
jgi:hypothetical protein